MNRHEPQGSESSREGRVVRMRLVVEPVQERGHFLFDAASRRRLKVNSLPSDGAGDDLHRAACVIAPGAGLDADHAAAARGKQGGMPVEQSVLSLIHI